jgi:uncharacterized membrane protein YphA (DoxX/SURF4 family)
MSTVTANYTSSGKAATTSAAHQVTNVLRITYGILPIAAGADKFMHLLVNWDQYLAPAIANLLPFAPHTFMLIVGVIEMVAGILVLVKPKIGSLIVALWLLGIVINLLIYGQYLDVAVRDLVMSIGAFCLYTLVRQRQ